MFHPSKERAVMDFFDLRPPAALTPAVESQSAEILLLYVMTLIQSDTISLILYSLLCYLAFDEMDIAFGGYSRELLVNHGVGTRSLINSGN